MSDPNDHAFDQAALIFRAFTRAPHSDATDKDEILCLKQKSRAMAAALLATSERLREHETTGIDVSQLVQDCVLCFEPVEPHQAHVQIPLCRHLYHAECFDQCVKDTSRCPKCRCQIGVLLRPDAGTKPFPKGPIAENPKTPPPSPRTEDEEGRSERQVSIVQDGMLQNLIFDAFMSGGGSLRSYYPV